MTDTPTSDYDAAAADLVVRTLRDVAEATPVASKSIDFDPMLVPRARADIDESIRRRRRAGRDVAVRRRHRHGPTTVDTDGTRLAA